MPKELKQQQNLFIKKSLNRHLGVGGPSNSDNSRENSRTSTPTVSEDESGTKASRGTEPGDTERTQTPPSRPSHSSTEVAADERAARLRSEQFQQALNDSANEAETSSVSATSSDGRDSRTGGDYKTSKRPMKNKRDHPGRGGYSHRGGFRGKFDRRDSGRMGHGHGHYPRGPRPMNMMGFQHRPPPPIHMLEQLSQSPHRDSAFMTSPRRTPRHSESSSCGSPRLYSGAGQTPPQSPRHFYESPIQSPLRHHISPYNSPPRHPASPIPRMMHPAEHLMQPHPAMMARQHPMPGSVPIPMPPQPELGSFSGTPPPHFHPMNSPHMRPMTPEQHHIMSAMQQRAVEQQQQQQQQHQQLEQHHIAQQMKMKQNQDSLAQMFAQMQQMTVQGQNVTLTPEQCVKFMQYCSMANQHGANMMPGVQNMVPAPWMQQGAPQPEMMNHVPQPSAEMSPQMIHQLQMGHHVNPMFLQQQQMQGFLSGQMLPGQPLPGQPLPGQPLSGQSIPGPMPGAIPTQRFIQSQLQGQQIMIPRPIHPEMGNTSNITPPQNRDRHTPLMDPAHGMPARQFGLQIPVQPAPTTQPNLVPASDVAVSSPSLPPEDTTNSVIETSTDVPAPVSSGVKTPQDTYQSSAVSTNTSKSTELPPSSSEALPPSAKTSTAPETTPVKQPTKTPGLIRLPPQLPTEEDLLKSPDAGGTPVNMKKNYWQNRQKSSESVEKRAPEITPLKEEPEKKTADLPPVPVSEVEKEKTEVKLPSDSADRPVKPAAEKPVPAETPKKKSERQIKTKGFNLSDLGDLVTKTVTHNNNIPKTDISAAANSGNVEIVLSQGYRRTHSPCQARAVDSRDRAADTRDRDGTTWRPLTKPKPEAEEEPSGGGWRVEDNPANASKAEDNPASSSKVQDNPASSIKVLEDDPERTKALQEAEAKALSTGHSIQYAIEKLQKESRIKSVSESSSKGPKEEVAGEEAWYDEEDEDGIDCFDLTI